MAYSQQQAQQYYNTLTPEQRSAVDATGGPSVEWFTNAVNAGVPAAGQIAGGQRQEDIEAGGETGGGYQVDWKDAAEPTEWLGKRKPTPPELRKYYHQQGRSEDLNRYSDRTLATAWLPHWDVAQGGFLGAGGQIIDKPTETGGVLDPAKQGKMGAGGGGMGGGGMGGGAQPGPGGTYGGAPAFTYEDFVPPSYEEAMADPGYQFSLREGADAIQRSAAAQGLLRSSGTLKGLIDYGQDRATQQYGDVYNRAAQTFATNYGIAKDEFAPQYGSWQTNYAGNLAKWQTQYGGNLQKYLQKEQNIYDLLNMPPPAYPGY